MAVQFSDVAITLYNKMLANANAPIICIQVLSGGDNSTQSSWSAPPAGQGYYVLGVEIAQTVLIYSVATGYTLNLVESVSGQTLFYGIWDSVTSTTNVGRSVISSIWFPIPLFWGNSSMIWKFYTNGSISGGFLVSTLYISQF